MSRHLMAKMRRHAAGGNGPDFDWQPRPSGGLEGYHAKLENGDIIHLYGLHSKRKGQPSKWSYHIMGAPDPEVQMLSRGKWSKPGVWTVTDHPNVRPFLGSGGQGDLKAEEEADRSKRTSYTPLRLPTMHHDKIEAMLAAEQHYRALNRTGQGRSGLDSGVDYDQFFKGEDLGDDDFGDIFGGGR